MKFKFKNLVPWENGNLIKITMKAFIFLFCSTILAFVPKEGLSQNEKITIEENISVSVNEVFNLIESQTDYNFIFRSNLFENIPKVYLKKGTIKISELLDYSLAKTVFTYEFSSDEVIILNRKPMFVGTDLVELPQQTIRGKVTDVDGIGIPGVNIIVVDKKRGIISDFNGDYEITVSTGDKISFSYIGYQTQVVDIISTQTELNITLLEDVSELEEILIIGYGTQKLNEVSSSIATANSKQIGMNTLGNSSFDQALGGVMKGVLITSMSGKPGSKSSINIRGITSPFNGSDNEPLFVIDGVVFQPSQSFDFSDSRARFAKTGNPLESIDPNDIERIDVLKDAAATAIYGSRGANGVIIVTLKSGKRNQKAVISVSYATTFGKPINTPQYLSKDKWMNFMDVLHQNSVEGANVGSVSRSYLDFYQVPYTRDPITNEYVYAGNEGIYGDGNTDWVKESFRDVAVINSYSVAIRGGSEEMDYNVTLANFDQEGLLLNDRLKKYTARLSFNVDMRKIIKTGVSLNFTNINNKTGYSDSNNALGSLDLNARPDVDAYDAEGNILKVPYMSRNRQYWAASPIAITGAKDDQTLSNSILGSTFVEVEVIENLKLKLDVNAAIFSTQSSSFFPASKLRTDRIGRIITSESSSLTNTSNLRTNVITNLTANYTKSFDQHTIDAMFGASWDRSKIRKTYNYYKNFPDDDILTSVDFASETGSYGGGMKETGLNSLFGRLNYKFDNKYFATVTMRRDASPKFGPGNEAAFMPSLALSWSVMNENFLLGNSTINDLRVRASYGQTGQSNITDFPYLQFFQKTDLYGRDVYNGDLAIGLHPNLPNPDIVWELTTEVNIGVDYSLFNSRLRGSLDVYNRQTKGAIMAGFFPLETGAVDYLQNFGDLSNKGFELMIGGTIINKKDFVWDVELNLSKNKNTLEKFSADAISSSLARYYEVGKPVNLIRGHEVIGMFQTQAEVDALNATAPDGFYQEKYTGPGDYIYKDINGDGEIDNDDQTVLGTSLPDYFGGFSSLFSYKQFELNAFFTYSIGGKQSWSFTASRGISPSTKMHNVVDEFEVSNRWSPENPDAKYPRLIYRDPNKNTRTSSALIYDRSFLRLKTVRLGYTLPKTVTEKLGISFVNIYVAGSNLITWTSYPGVNPESLTSNLSSRFSTANKDAYPISKTFSLGLNLNF